MDVHLFFIALVALPARVSGRHWVAVAADLDGSAAQVPVAACGNAHPPMRLVAAEAVQTALAAPTAVGLEATVSVRAARLQMDQLAGTSEASS